VHLICDVVAFGDSRVAYLARGMVNKFTISITWFRFWRGVFIYTRTIILAR